MRSRVCPALVLLLVACSSGSKHESTTSSASTDGSDAPACETGRCLDDISKLISEHRAESRACYEAGAKKQPGLQGRLIINFRIDQDGNVTEASQGMQEDQITDEGVVTCVSDVIKKIKFASSPSGKTTRAYHQFEFSK